MKNYGELCETIKSLISGVPHTVANLANASAAIYDFLDDVNWAGFYVLRGETLVLGPFQGKPACIEIPVGRGVCGEAARTRKTVSVKDVHAFKGHIACDSASRSEIVVPLFKGEELFGVLDIDSPIRARFSDVDRLGLEEAAKIIEKCL